MSIILKDWVPEIIYAILLTFNISYQIVFYKYQVYYGLHNCLNTNIIIPTLRLRIESCLHKWKWKIAYANASGIIFCRVYMVT